MDLRARSGPLSEEQEARSGSSAKTEHHKTRRFFNFVAPIYPLIEKSLVPSYTKVLDQLELNPELRVLDLATGTGILAGVFAERGHQVVGLDFAKNLLDRARQQFPQISFRTFDLQDLASISDQSFGIVSMGFLLHGVDPDFRHHVLFQAARIATEKVVVFDYGCRGNLLVRFIEWVEGPHYPGFLAASRTEEFSSAGLLIEKDLFLSRYARVWLCRREAVGRTTA